MSTAAIITMILIQGSVTAVTIYIFYLILKPMNKDLKGPNKKER